MEKPGEAPGKIDARRPYMYSDKYFIHEVSSLHVFDYLITNKKDIEAFQATLA